MRRALMVLLLVVASSPQLAEADEKSACVSAYRDAQLRRRSGALRQAREQLLVCSNEACPNVVKADCVPWLGEVTRAIASILVTAHDEGGNARSDVTVRLNGEVLARSLDGRAIEVDPGNLVLRFEAPGTRAGEVRAHLAEGERDRRILVTLMPSPSTVSSAPNPETSGTSSSPGASATGTPNATTTEPATGSRPLPASAIVLGGVAGLGGAGFAVFGALGSSALKPLAACRPSCNTPSDASTLNGVKRDYVVADVSLGVGVVSLALATYLYFTRPTIPADTPSLDVRATAGGVFVSRSFRW